MKRSEMTSNSTKTNVVSGISLSVIIIVMVLVVAVFKCCYRKDNSGSVSPSLDFAYANVFTASEPEGIYYAHSQPLLPSRQVGFKGITMESNSTPPPKLISNGCSTCNERPNVKYNQEWYCLATASLRIRARKGNYPKKIDKKRKQERKENDKEKDKVNRHDEVTECPD